MNIDEIKEVVDRIIAKRGQADAFARLKTYIDDRTDPSGLVTITVEKETFAVDPVELKKLLDKEALKYVVTQDEVELKNKAK